MRRGPLRALAHDLLVGRGPGPSWSPPRTRRIRTETVDGDLKGAIQRYQAIVARYKDDRAVAATALVHMAECYRKQGDAEAQKIYERVVREYADQKEAVAVARARLGGSETAARVKGERAVWTGPRVDLFGRVSPDGRSITYVDWNTGSLCLHDLQKGADHVLTKGYEDAGQFAQSSTFSRDGKEVAYGWFNGKDRYELRTALLVGTSVPQPRRLFDNEDIRDISPFDWSSDGKWIAVHLLRHDLNGQIALVSVPDGALRVLKSVDWRGPGKIFFSPDGKYVAYDLSVGDVSDQRDVYIMAVDGSRETAAVAHPSRDIVMGWSPDGRCLLFASDRAGSMGLWALPVAEGKPQGAPELLKPDLGSSWSLGLTAAGALYVYKNVSNRGIQVASIDLDAGKLLAPPVRAIEIFERTRGPEWSPDGTHVTSVSCGHAGGGPCFLLIRSMATGQVRELRPKLWYLVSPRWAPDGRSFVTAGRDLKGRNGIYRFDAQTGDTSLVVFGPPLGASPQWAPDGKRIYYRLGDRLLERDLSSGNEREVIRRPWLRGFSVSPDGRYVVAPGPAESSTESTILLLVPLAGGEPRELHRWKGEFKEKEMTWTPDSRATLVFKKNGDSAELWLVPVADGQPRKLDIDVNTWGRNAAFSLHPDGRQIAFLAGKAEAEVWALENFLPALSAK